VRVTVVRPTGVATHPLLATVGLMLTSAVALGMARFAYALVLPTMRADLSWSFATAGALNTANAFGYLAGTILAAPVARRLGERRAFRYTLATTGLALLATASTANILVLLGFRLLAGLAGAICFVVGASLVAQAGRDLSRSRATRLLTVYFAGGGVGIVLSGLAIPAVLAAGGWRSAWIVLGLLSLLALVAAVPAAAAVPETSPAADGTGRRHLSLRPLTPLLASYGLFGAGYIAYMTFVVAAVAGAGAGNADITVFWVVLGVCAATAGFGWSRVINGLPAGAAIATVELPLVVGAFLPALDADRLPALASAVLFGGTFLTVVTAVTAAIRQALPADQWTAGISAIASAFAVGQCVGPVLAGALSDSPAGVRAGLLLGAGLLVGSAVTALLHDRAGR
jgi:predicted MFS family arabinose efflux permease